MHWPVAKTISPGSSLLCQCAGWLWQEIALRVTKQAKHIFRLRPAHLDLVVQLKRSGFLSSYTWSSNSLWRRIRAWKPSDFFFFFLQSRLPDAQGSTLETNCYIFPVHKLQHHDWFIIYHTQYVKDNSLTKSIAVKIHTVCVLAVSVNLVLGFAGEQLFKSTNWPVA